MSKKWSSQEKLAVLQEMKSDQMGLKAIAQKYNTGKTTLIKWRDRYELSGYEGLEQWTRNKSYSAELKLQAVKDYLSLGLSQSQIIRKYKIANRTQLRSWIQKYNGHSSLPSYNGGAKAMTKGRTTTWQERIDIVHYCLAHNHDYQKISNQYQVSYQQVYQWVKKFEDGSQDTCRGRKKAPEELTEADRQKLAIKKLEYENERLRAENAFLKSKRTK